MYTQTVFSARPIHFSYNSESTWTHYYQSKPHLTLGFTLGVTCSESFDTCVMAIATIIALCRIVLLFEKNVFCAPPAHLNTGKHLFLQVVFIVLPFLECHIVRITQYIP